MKILIADDDRTIHISFTKFLTEQGHEILHAYDASEAMQIASTQSPDLILLDITMPAGDGRNICQQLKSAQDTADIKIIMLTARDSQHDRTLAMELGADDFISKPCSIPYLDRAITKLTRK
ncbi:MAG: response regulator [Proteobacteria bacterium]|nr:response regulator transcription factor [Desulfobulbaceae bacterium]MBU4151793.1 response regulator [Pseudomonadota bacterium]MDP2105360.1 response regulator [Desulfobulbaceae bacterium]